MPRPTQDLNVLCNICAARQKQTNGDDRHCYYSNDDADDDSVPNDGDADRNRHNDSHYGANVYSADDCKDDGDNDPDEYNDADDDVDWPCFYCC